MDLNLAVVSGRLAATPEVKIYDSELTVTRLLVVTNQTEPKRVDVVPVIVWGDVEVPEGLKAGDRIYVAGAIQRRFWNSEHEATGRRSRIEIVAKNVEAFVDEEVV